MKENKRKPGRPTGTTKDRANLNTTIARENMELLRRMREQGYLISATLDRLIEQEWGKLCANRR